MAQPKEATHLTWLRKLAKSELHTVYCKSYTTTHDPKIIFFGWEDRINYNIIVVILFASFFQTKQILPNRCLSQSLPCGVQLHLKDGHKDFGQNMLVHAALSWQQWCTGPRTLAPTHQQKLSKDIPLQWETCSIQCILTHVSPTLPSPGPPIPGLAPHGSSWVLLLRVTRPSPSLTDPFHGRPIRGWLIQGISSYYRKNVV